MAPPTAIALAITETTQVGQARRAVTTLARLLKFDETAEGRVAVVVNELGNNLIKHGGGGELIAQPWTHAAAPTLQLWALDRGRGMANIGECMRDGYSTAGSPGTGLGAVSRLADTFEIYSLRDQGTVAYADIAAAKLPPVAKPCAFAALNVPFAGETVSGDDWAINYDSTHLRAMMVDGLGHGTIAAAAATAAVAAWHEYGARSSPVEFLQRAHMALRATRGAAVAVAWIDYARRNVWFAGLGNIGATLISPSLKTRSMVSVNGTAGMEIRRLQEFNYAYEANAVLIMHTDGFTTRWRLDNYPGLVLRHPALIAGVLYRDHKRGRDDATVAVIKL